MALSPDQHATWLEQWQADKLVNQAQAVSTLRQLAVAVDIGTGPGALERLAPQIRQVVSDHELLIRQLCHPEERTLRGPAYAPSTEREAA